MNNDQNQTPTQSPQSTSEAPQPTSHDPSHQPPTQTDDTTNGLAIAGLVLAFIIPIVGLILSIISLSQIKKNRQQGRGLAIAGIVISAIFIIIIPIAILTALTLTTFTGVQQKARDTERSTDLKAMASHAEVINTQTGSYPSLSQFNDSAWRTQNMPGLDNEALRDPQSSSYVLVSTPTKSAYAYEVLPNDCDNTKVKCVSFTMTAISDEGSNISIASLSSQSLSSPQ